jgi:hypothetical protein
MRRDIFILLVILSHRTRLQAGQSITYIQSQLGHARILIIMDVHGQLFTVCILSKKQVAFLDGSFNAVRKSLENEATNKKEATANAVTS